MITTFPNGRFVESWYDRSSRSWITERKDTHGYPIGEAEYNGTRAGMRLSHAGAVAAEEAA